MVTDRKMLFDTAVWLVAQAIQTEYGPAIAIDYWETQVKKYLNGNRGPDMHDATLVYMSRRFPDR